MAQINRNKLRLLLAATLDKMRKEEPGLFTEEANKMLDQLIANAKEIIRLEAIAKEQRDGYHCIDCGAWISAERFAHCERCSECQAEEYAQFIEDNFSGKRTCCICGSRLTDRNESQGDTGVCIYCAEDHRRQLEREFNVPDWSQYI